MATTSSATGLDAEEAEEFGGRAIGSIVADSPDPSLSFGLVRTHDAAAEPPAPVATGAGARPGVDSGDAAFAGNGGSTPDFATARAVQPEPAHIYAEMAPDLSPQDAQSDALMGVNAFRADARFAGIDGSGYSVVVIDTGINYSHPYFSGHIAYSYDFYGSNDADASDYGGHGSNVASIAAGSIGVAPGANIIALKVFPDAGGGAWYSDIEEALQWVINNGAAYNVVSVNLSLGSGVNYTTASTHWYLGNEFQALASQGIVTVAAAGNSYYSYQTQGASDIAADPNVIGVGAVYDGNSGGWSYGSGAIAYSSSADQITPFSQRSTTLVDIFAPGAPITGAGASGSSTVTMHGTSQATPQIAGIVALAQELAVQTIGRKLTVAEFTSLLTSSALTIYDGDNENDNVANTNTYYKRADVLALGQAILALDAPTTITGTAGNDVLTATRKSLIYGLDGNDTLTGSSGNDTLDGGSGNDLINGVGGTDTLIGGAGNDAFVVDNGSTTVVENAGGGIDSVYASVSLTLPSNVEVLVMTGSGNLAATGSSGNDTLFGNSGNNVLNGAAGADYMSGGTGNDTYYVDNAGDTVVEQAGQGTADRVISTLANATVVANVEVLELGGTGNITALGGAGNDTLVGNSGSNLLDGGAGADRMAGGGGNDAYVVDNAGDTAMELYLPTVLSGWTVKGVADFNLDGEADVLVTNGTSANQVWLLTGGVVSGTIALSYWAGIPVQGFIDRNGDGWKDVLYQVTGSTAQQVNFYMGGPTQTGYQVTYGAGLVADALPGNEGTDTVTSSVSYVLAAGVENLVLASGAGAINGTGNAQDNTITGNEGANTLTGGGGVDTLDGGAGADTLIGGLGDDVYLVDDADDVVVEAAGPPSVPAGWTVKGWADFDHNGEADLLVTNGTSANQVWLMSGGVVSSTIALSYWAGIPVQGFIDRNGDGWKDVLYQVTGSTTQQVNFYMGGPTQTGYQVTYGAGLMADALPTNEGSDSVAASVNHALAAGVENLLLMSGAGDINGTGNALDNILVGNEGDNTLIGGAGADTLVGYSGDDLFTFAPGCGADRILDFIAGGTTDEIDLTGFGFASFAAVTSQAQDQGGNVVINLAPGDVLTIVGVSLAQLQSGDFVL